MGVCGGCTVPVMSAAEIQLSCFKRPFLFSFLLITELLYSPPTFILLKRAVIKLIYEAATVMAGILWGVLGGSNVGKSEPAVEADLVFI